MKNFKPIIVIPFYNHIDRFKKVCVHFFNLKSPVLVVNDGSEPHETGELKAICNKYDFLYMKLEKNSGKGKAVIEGIKYAIENRYTHVLQIDADGQHNISDIPKFLSEAKKNSDSIICGDPIYDKTAPKSRFYGRKITKFWVWVETFGTKIPDAMCGFRIYPVNMIKKIISKIYFMRMGFDIEILVKSYLNGIKIIGIPTKVTYPKDGISHFDGIRDNIKISLAHTHLCLYAIYVLLIKWSKKCLILRK